MAENEQPDDADGDPRQSTLFFLQEVFIILEERVPSVASTTTVVRHAFAVAASGLRLAASWPLSAR